MQGSVLVPLLAGFEEIEAVVIIDVLRRAEVQVVVAGEQAGPVEGAHGISVRADVALADVDPGSLAMIALPGGMPGAAHLARHPVVQRLIRDLSDAGRYTAAICAAPIALAAAGVHAGRRVTSYPGFATQLAGATYVDERVVVDGTLVTSRGPGTALEFALALVGLLKGPAAERHVAERMLVDRVAPAATPSPGASPSLTSGARGRA
jgi:4-methyl-5(b-hydroxyethyl)-thiazole monophosphate biosynthesis